MKRFAPLLILLLLLISAAAGAEAYDVGGVTLTSEGGVVTALAQGDSSLRMDGVYVDVGCDGAFVQNTIGFQRFWDMNTWDLAPIVPKVQKPTEKPHHLAALPQAYLSKVQMAIG